ncbi:hypothetical protein COCMIDRAFT_85884 [Bipolaris oryzae ATCC 44560]|uniref:Uncharacterized protein n=1 Tax=Bipolaris oryzae ATCC 44560 TaxID=930090 RepID=W6ZN49_COCMI|nr:uncharacterized protein COCMIDRAFT_85884 [Bipolaris oryzae ATCC 44560]EUC48924.1 hypothetical protein COCMIDRAFT_85884 [Bipolaris oryzae ATCC 44560]
MNTFGNALPPTPPGIAPEVLSKIEALFQNPNFSGISVAMDEQKHEVPATDIPNALADIVCKDQSTREESNPLINETEVLMGYDSDTDPEGGARLSNQRHRVKGRGARKKHTRSIAKYDCSIQRIVARFEYPSETSLAPISSIPRSPNAIKSTSNSLLNIFSAFTHSIYCVSKYLTHRLPFPFSLVRLLISSYLNVGTEYKMNIRVEVEPKKVVRVLAFVGGGENVDIGCVEPVEIQARYKRVREIMRECGCWVEEDLYSKQIKKSLGRLKE